MCTFVESMLMKVAQLGVRSTFWGESGFYNFQSFLGQQYFLNPVTKCKSSQTIGSLISCHAKKTLIMKDLIVLQLKPWPCFMGHLCGYCVR